MRSDKGGDMKARLIYIAVIACLMVYVLQAIAAVSASGDLNDTFSWFDGR